jgi:hypothetical protein
VEGDETSDFAERTRGALAGEVGSRVDPTMERQLPGRNRLSSNMRKSADGEAALWAIGGSQLADRPSPL